MLRRAASWPAQGFSLRQLQHLVLDEADRILSLDFEEDVDKILKARSFATGGILFGLPRDGSSSG